MLLFGCLLAFGVAMAPRLVLILAWIFGRRWDIVWQGNWFVPLLGIIFLPYTTVMYILVWSPTGLNGFDWVWLAMGVLLDIMKWGQIMRNREGIPGQQKSTAQPAAQTAAPSATTQQMPEESSVQSELDGLVKLRDEGVITEEEYEAKKNQLET